jgi:hypothetical protein
VQSELNRLTNMLPSWKGPERVDRTILYGSGQLVAGGFGEGFTDTFEGSVRTQMGDLTTALPSAVGARGGRGAGGGDTIIVQASAIITNDRELIRIVDQARERVARQRSYRPAFAG